MRRATAECESRCASTPKKCWHRDVIMEADETSNGGVRVRCASTSKKCWYRDIITRTDDMNYRTALLWVYGLMTPNYVHMQCRKQSAYKQPVGWIRICVHNMFRFSVNILKKLTVVLTKKIFLLPLHSLPVVATANYFQEASYFPSLLIVLFHCPEKEVAKTLEYALIFSTSNISILVGLEVFCFAD